MRKMELAQLVMSTSSQLGRLRSATRRYQPALLAAGLALFAGGLAYSLAALDLEPQKLRYSLLAPITLAVAAAVLVNALEQWFAGRALALDYSFGQALAASGAATIANILPLPGGLLVRGASLAAHGASTRDSAAILAFGAAIWVLLAAAVMIAAAAPGWGATRLAVALITGSLALTGWLGWRFDPVNALALLGTRALLLALTVVRLGVILALLGQEAAWREAALYSGASLAGQVIGVIPSGIGLVEAVGAGMALAIDAPPEAAFLALSLNRIFGLAAAGIVMVPGIWNRNGATRSAESGKVR